MPCLENCKIDKLKLAGLYQGLISTEDKCLSRQNCKIEIGVFGSRLDVHSRQTNMWIISVVLNWTSALGGVVDVRECCKHRNGKRSGRI